MFVENYNLVWLLCLLFFCPNHSFCLSHAIYSSLYWPPSPLFFLLFSPLPLCLSLSICSSFSLIQSLSLSVSLSYSISLCLCLSLSISISLCLSHLADPALSRLLHCTACAQDICWRRIINNNQKQKKYWCMEK